MVPGGVIGQFNQFPTRLDHLDLTVKSQDRSSRAGMGNRKQDMIDGHCPTPSLTYIVPKVSSPIIHKCQRPADCIVEGPAFISERLVPFREKKITNKKPPDANPDDDLWLQRWHGSRLATVAPS